MLTEAHGTLVVIDTIPPRLLRPRTLWHLARRPELGYYEARPWFRDPITREYNEGETKVLACSVAGARRLMPAGLEPAAAEDVSGLWFSAPAAGRAAA